MKTCSQSFRSDYIVLLATKAAIRATEDSHGRISFPGRNMESPRGKITQSLLRTEVQHWGMWF